MYKRQENTDTQSNGVKMSIGEKLETKVVVGAIKDNIDKISKEEDVYKRQECFPPTTKNMLCIRCDMRISAICAVKAAVPLRSDICCFDNLCEK